MLGDDSSQLAAYFYTLWPAHFSQAMSGIGRETLDSSTQFSLCFCSRTGAYKHFLKKFIYVGEEKFFVVHNKFKTFLVNFAL